MEEAVPGWLLPATGVVLAATVTILYLLELISETLTGAIMVVVVPLACGGADKVANLQWQTIQQARAKDRAEPTCPARMPQEQRHGCGVPR